MSLHDGQAIQDRLARASEYERRAVRYIQNAREMAGRGELAKAGEMLWGALASYLNAISILMRGRPSRSHRELLTIGREVALARGDRELLLVLERDAQALHANFYHDFMTRETFGMYLSAIFRVAGRLSLLCQELRRALSKL